MGACPIWTNIADHPGKSRRAPKVTPFALRSDLAATLLRSNTRVRAKGLRRLRLRSHSIPYERISMHWATRGCGLKSFLVIFRLLNRFFEFTTSHRRYVCCDCLLTEIWDYGTSEIHFPTLSSVLYRPQNTRRKHARCLVADFGEVYFVFPPRF